MPGPSSAGLAGRILAESIRALASALAALATGIAHGAIIGGPAAIGWTLAVLGIVSWTAGTVGVMLGHVVETPQGAVAFAPLVMAAMFFNTAMMPREMYAEALRPLVDVSPVTALIQLIREAGDGLVDPGHVALVVGWFGALEVLAFAVLTRRARARR